MMRMTDNRMDSGEAVGATCAEGAPHIAPELMSWITGPPGKPVTGAAAASGGEDAGLPRDICITGQGMTNGCPTPA